MLEFTSHAHRRLQQRGMTYEYASLVMEYGTAVNTAGAVFYFMSKKDIPQNLPGTIKDRILGITLVVNPENNDVMTVYKNQNAMKSIRKKPRYDRYSTYRKNNEKELQ